MEQIYIEEETFNKQNFTQNYLAKGEYDHCTFINCNFSDSSLANIIFLDCEFIDCNLSLTELASTAFRDVKFKDSKMLGLRFDHCDDFGLSFSFENCLLNHSSFYKTKVKKTFIKNSKLHEVDFTGGDLTSSVFDNCDFAGSTFENTIIEKADFRTSFNYSINPEVNRMKKAKFSLAGIPGLLDKYDIVIDN